MSDTNPTGTETESDPGAADPADGAPDGAPDSPNNPDSPNRPDPNPNPSATPSPGSDVDKDADGNAADGPSTGK